MDARKLAQDATAQAQSKPAAAPATSHYSDLFGPVEVAGGHGDAWITESPSGVRYIEYRPRSGGRVKRAPLTAVTAVFPQLLDVPAPKAGAKK